MQPTKVMCHGTAVMFYCYSPLSPDHIWKPLIERTFQKWKQLTKDNEFFSAYLQGNLAFLLIKKDNEVQIHHWLKPEENEVVPAEILKIANSLRNYTELNKGFFAAELQPWKNSI